MASWADFSTSTLSSSTTSSNTSKPPHPLNNPAWVSQYRVRYWSQRSAQLFTSSPTLHAQLRLMLLTRPFSTPGQARFCQLHHLHSLGLISEPRLTFPGKRGDGEWKVQITITLSSTELPAMPAVGHGYSQGAAQAEAAGLLLENLRMLSAPVDPASISPSSSTSTTSTRTTPDPSRRSYIAAAAPLPPPRTEVKQSPAEHEQALCKRYGIPRRKGPYVPETCTVCSYPVPEYAPPWRTKSICPWHREYDDEEKNDQTD
jgi:hypothetical protein